MTGRVYVGMIALGVWGGGRATRKAAQYTLHRHAEPTLKTDQILRTQLRFAREGFRSTDRQILTAVRPRVD